MFFDEAKEWFGEGKLTVSDVKDPIAIHIQLELLSASSQRGHLIYAHQLNMYELDEIVHNKYVLRAFDKGKFFIEISNEAWGRVSGVGLFTEKFFGFEIESEENSFHGYEYYQKTEKGIWTVEGEYVSSGEMRSHLKGEIEVKEPIHIS